jgi:hypothetical protein
MEIPIGTVFPCDILGEGESKWELMKSLNDVYLGKNKKKVIIIIKVYH